MEQAHRQTALDALRGIAILLVLFFHFPDETGTGPVILRPFATAGWAGVDLFFVLSGFLVGGIVLREVEATGRFDAPRFLVRRAFRLWPVLYLYVATLWLTGYDWNGLWPVLLHVQNYAETTPSHLWSLAVEEHFYLAAAFVLPWLARRGDPRAIVALLVAVIVAASASRIAALQSGITPRYAQWQTQFRIDALAVGVLIAATSIYRPHWLQALRRIRGALVIVAVVGFAVLASDPAPVERWGTGLIVAWIASAALVIAASDVVVPRLIVTPMRTFAALGLIAYPLYIWHASIGHTAGALAKSHGLTQPLAVIVIEMAAAIAFAVVVHRFVEQPFMTLRDRLGSRRSRTAGLASATA